MRHAVPYSCIVLLSEQKDIIKCNPPLLLMVGITLIVAQGITGDIPTMAVAHQEMLRLRICFDEHSQFNAQLSSCLRPARCALKGAGIANLLELSGDSQQ